MPETPTCPRCGTPLAKDSLTGLCPRCVLGVALQTPPVGPDSRAPSIETLRGFGDYELLEEIARGGMGVVFKARQTSLNRVVAVKMILAGPFASKELVWRFQAEAEAAARLQHPNIVAIHEVGEHNGQHFFSMDYVDGRDLAALTRDQPLPAMRAAGYMLGIAEAIQYAHERNILHRDLKPSNILIDPFDQPRITDFGLAKHLQTDTALTLTGQVLGSPGYLAPEQASGRRGEIGPRSDVYALGAILFHLLTGRAPFAAETPGDAIQAVLNEEPIPPRRLNSSVPADLETICLKCLEKNPAHRYESARALADELARFSRGEPILARPVSKPVQAWRWCRRRPVVASLLAAVVLLLVALALGSNIAAFRIKRAERLATEKLRDSYLDQARARRVSGRLGQRYESLAAISNAAALHPSPELRLQLRNEAIACLALTDAKLVQLRPLALASRIEFVRFTPNLEHYVRLEERGRVSMRRAANDEEIALLPLKLERLSFFHGFSPDGRCLAVQYGPGILEIWDVGRRQLRFRVRIAPGYCDFAPDNQRIAVSAPAGGVIIYDLETGQPWKEIHSGLAYGYVRFDPAGKRIAWFNLNVLAVEVREVESGTLQRSLPQTERVTDLSWDGQGNLLAAACEEGGGVVWDVETGEKRFVLEGHDNRMVRINFSHNRRWIASSSWDDTIRLWDGFTGRPVLRLPGMSYQLRFSEDDHRLAFTRQNDRFGLVELALRPEFTTLLPDHPSHGPFDVAFSPDGRLLANSGSAGVQLWNVDSGNAAGFIPEAKCRSVLFTPDGLEVITGGFNGVARWPVPFEGSNRHGAVRIGVRESLPLAGAFMQVVSSADGKILAAVSQDKGRAHVFPLEKPDRSVSLSPHPSAQFVALSPDARWAATGPWGGKEVKVWDTRSGSLLSKLPASVNTAVAFSPDGQWLVTAGEDYRLWKTGSWEPGPPISLPGKNAPLGYAAFSPDSRTLAVVHAGWEVHLLEVSTGRPLAVFETPAPVRLSAPCFSPDGTFLATAGAKGEVYLWNLRLIRQSLAAMRLDWEPSIR